MQSRSKGTKWTGRYYSDNILSQIATLRDVGSDRKMIVHADNGSPNGAKRVTEYLDHTSLKRAHRLPIHLIWHHLIFTYLDVLGIDYRDMNSQKEPTCFGCLRNFASKSD
jgi:hypothetical protein